MAAHPFEIQYLVEMLWGDRPIATMELPPTTTIEETRNPATTMTWTLGKWPVREHEHEREWIIDLSGVSGFEHRLGSDRYGGDMYASGADLQRELREFFLRYEKLCAEIEHNKAKIDEDTTVSNTGSELGRLLGSVAGGPLAIAGAVAGAVLGGDTGSEASIASREIPKLVFRALWEQIDVYIEPASIRMGSSVGANCQTYSWALTFRTYGKATPKPKSLFAQIRDMMRDAARCIDNFNIYLAKADRWLVELDATLESVKEPIRAVRRSTELISDIAGDVTNIMQFPGEILEEILLVAEGAATSVVEIWGALPGVDRQKTARTIRAIENAIETVRVSALVAMGYQFRSRARVSTGSADRPPERIAGTALKRYSGPAAEYEVAEGDTLASIASQVLGDPEAWTEIAALNGMIDPWTLPGGKPLGAGATLLVPVSGPGAAILGGPDIEQSVYGQDFRRGPDGDYIGLGDDPEQLQLISGMENYVAKLEARLSTFQGHYAAYPGFGIPNMIGKGAPYGTAAYLASHARMQLLADPRTDSVDRLAVTDEGDAYYVDARVKPVSGREFKASASIQTAHGDG